MLRLLLGGSPRLLVGEATALASRELDGATYLLRFSAGLQCAPALKRMMIFSALSHGFKAPAPPTITPATATARLLGTRLEVGCFHQGTAYTTSLRVDVVQRARFRYSDKVCRKNVTGQFSTD